MYTDQYNPQSTTSQLNHESVFPPTSQATHINTGRSHDRQRRQRRPSLKKSIVQKVNDRTRSPNADPEPPATGSKNNSKVQTKRHNARSKDAFKPLPIASRIHKHEFLLERNVDRGSSVVKEIEAKDIGSTSSEDAEIELAKLGSSPGCGGDRKWNTSGDCGERAHKCLQRGE